MRTSRLAPLHFRRRHAFVAFGTLIGIGQLANPIAAEPRASHTTEWGEPQACNLDADSPTAVDGTFTADEAKTYRMIPFEVPKGTTRVEVGYSWDDIAPAPENPNDKSTVDLGLWDNDGYREYDGFRGWSGSRQGKIAQGMEPIWVQADTAERGYNPGAIEPGTWWVELGAGGIAPNGATYHVEISCHSGTSRPDAKATKTRKSDPVDATHIANPEAGWYYGDFHLHAYHSNNKGPAGAEMVAAAKAKGLDIIPVTEYVTNTHWDELGEAQRSNPEILIWPGREIITYYGHAITLGETRNTIEYRHGFEGVTLRDIQASAKADGALFSVAHPTVFPGKEFENFCRGCNFTLGDNIKWDLVDTMEIHSSDIAESPFTKTAVALWDEKLNAGYKITGISGADNKLGDKYGQTVTAVYADELSRDAVATALLRGNAYVMVRGRENSPTLAMTATAPDGTSAIFGDTIVADASATVTANLQIEKAKGQTLEIVKNGTVVETRTIDADPYTATLELSRDAATEGPLGTYWRIQTLDGANLTAISNPMFLANEAPLINQVSSSSNALTDADAEQALVNALDNMPEPILPAKSNDRWKAGLLGAGIAVVAIAARALFRRRRSAKNRRSGQG